MIQIYAVNNAFGLKERAKILTDDLFPKNRRCRNQHSLAFQIPLTASTNAYLHSFFSPRLLEIGMNSSSAEMSDDCVSKFTHTCDTSLIIRETPGNEP